MSCCTAHVRFRGKADIPRGRLVVSRAAERKQSNVAVAEGVLLQTKSSTRSCPKFYAKSNTKTTVKSIGETFRLILGTHLPGPVLSGCCQTNPLQELASVTA